MNFTALESYGRIGLRTHHLNYGSVENDKSWVPVLSLIHYFKKKKKNALIDREHEYNEYMELNF